MKFDKFRVLNYRNIKDSNWIDINSVTAFVGQNEAGKSNLFEALYRVNPYIKEALAYNLDEDWPVDDWGNKKNNQNALVCEAVFSLDEQETRDLFSKVIPAPQPIEGQVTPAEIILPKTIELIGQSFYNSSPKFTIKKQEQYGINDASLQQWVEQNVPKFVYIHDYDMSGAQIELDQLRVRRDSTPFNNLSNEDQTILIILELAGIDLNEFIEKGQTIAGRTTRSFDKRQASSYLSKQFKDLWRQKDVRFDIEVDSTTLNIFVEDATVGMPIRLNRRSTGFRWYVSFAWKFTHASRGQYNNCILLLEEPGIHLHYDGQRDLLAVFDALSSQNTILYSTHLASMVDLANPERVRIVEVTGRHTTVKNGIVSSQKAAMAVIETSLGLTGGLSGLLGNRQTLIVEGGDDTVILQKLSGVLKANGKTGLSEKIYLWPAKGASQTPMYAGFAVGNHWDAGVLLDNDDAGNKAKKKIEELYLSKLASGTKFFVQQIGKAAGIKKTDAAIEDLFPDEFYIECVNSAYRLGLKLDELPKDGSDMIVNRVETVLIQQHGMKELDKGRVMIEMLRRFDQWTELKDLPPETADKAEKLFNSINSAFNKK